MVIRTRNALENGKNVIEMLDDVSNREKHGIAVIFAVSIITAFSAGALASGSGSPTGDFAGNTGDVSEAQIQEKVQSLMDQQVQQQEQQLQQVVNQSENLTMDDLSINSEVTDVSRSKFNSLYRVNISMTGDVPNQLGSGTRSLDQTQTLYISSDGRYLFQEPTDLEQPQQQTQQRPQAPTGDQ